jgi:uncharacterized protein YndB with AHSA1/START domain
MTDAQPGMFRVQRSTLIDAAPDAIIPLIADFRAWTQWSPWEKLDADLARTYAGPNSGKGAVYAWEGRKAGAGRMEVLEATPGRRVVIQLAFLKPMRQTNLAEFVFERQDDGRTVVSRLMHAVLNFDKMVGKDFEAGLADLKAIAERAHAPA